MALTVAQIALIVANGDGGLFDELDEMIKMKKKEAEYFVKLGQNMKTLKP